MIRYQYCCIDVHGAIPEDESAYLETAIDRKVADDWRLHSIVVLMPVDHTSRHLLVFERELTDGVRA
jgi:hypothetical protein